MILYRFLASCGYIGYLPASGTWASLVTALAYYWLSPDFSWFYQLPVVMLVALVSMAICHKLTARQSDKDPSYIVIDEVVGMWLALMFAPADMISVAVIFVMFRLFDIVKPGPVGWADTHIRGGPGIMLDDIIAGVICIPVAMGLSWWNV